MVHVPGPGATLPRSTLVISGTAQDAGGGQVAAVEVSLDNGVTWHPARGRGEAWNYPWLPPRAGAYTILSRAVDDSGNLEQPDRGVAITIV